ncbi:MAG TPA: HlyD family type I secretion periplasmic adaptor subunit [Geminicoccaceae bacterium]|nr:HlyD family type I secretion periplasmic adaptor subunit [Geminicoccaceae bacterium]
MRPIHSDFDPLRSIRRNLLVGAVAGIALFGGIGGWAATTEFVGAVLAPGEVVVESHLKQVQHPKGGVVGELLVRDGQRVRAGEIVVRLDATVTRADLAVVTHQLDELAARQARLKAEREGAAAIGFPAELTARAAEPAIAALLAEEQRLFDLRRNALEGQRAQLRERVAQVAEETRGLAVQIKAKDAAAKLIEDELSGVRVLWEKQLMPIQRLKVLERDAAQVAGERGQLIAAAAQAKGRASELELQILQLDQDLRSEAAAELREVQARLAVLAEQRVAAEDDLRRVEIPAPQSGRVHQLAVHTVGGVIDAGQPIMLIVPDEDLLTVEARIAPQDIDQVSIGQAAALRLSAFDQRTTPEILGEVSRISADLTRDQRTQSAFYTARIALADDELARLGEAKLLPGMPVEVFIRTGERTVLSYLTKSLRDQVARAFRDG